MNIFSPNREYCGVSASVTFLNGEGKTDDPHLIKWFQDHGYKVEDEKLETPKKPTKGKKNQKKENTGKEENGQNFSEMDDDMLRAYADEVGIDLEGISSREEMILKLSEYSEE